MLLLQQNVDFQQQNVDFQSADRHLRGKLPKSQLLQYANRF